MAATVTAVLVIGARAPAVSADPEEIVPAEGDAGSNAGVVHVHDPFEVDAAERMAIERPMLRLDPPPTFARLGVVEESTQRFYELGHGASLVTGGHWWTTRGGDSGQTVGATDLDAAARGWRTGAEVRYRVGRFVLSAGRTYSGIDSRYERGTYALTGVGIRRTFRLAPGLLGWLSFGVGDQQWRGVPPTGEADGTTALVSFGFTF